VIETDYLVIGAGAAGMAFTDALVADSDAEVVMVDRRHGPGGHWNDAYPFVRLHQPAAYYGVNSRSLGSDMIDETGENAGMYERATAAQICDYYQRVLEEHLVPSGQVRFFGMSDYLGGDLDDGSARQPTDGLGGQGFVSRLTGATTTIAVRKKLVDARYLEPVIPLNHTPSFEIDPDATFIPVNGLAKMAEAANGYTIVGSGKTAIDACLWLLENGVDPDRIRWIRRGTHGCSTGWHSSRSNWSRISSRPSRWRPKRPLTQRESTTSLRDSKRAVSCGGSTRLSSPRCFVPRR
jgi:NAD(P)-binding Rossmann-like domain